MAARKKVWDLEAEGGPVELDMFAVDADEAVKNDPKRYTYEIPEGKVSLAEIPDDWPDLPSAKRRGLAIKLGAPNTIKVVDVDAFIQAELDKRAAA